MKQIFSFLFVSTFLSCASVVRAEEPLKPRAETNFRYGSERSILMTELWAPLTQDNESVVFGDLRLMGDDHDNREGNLGIGYRHVLDSGVIGKGVAGVHGWVDRRITKNDNTFHQVTVGTEWLGEHLDLRVNGYLGLTGKQRLGDGGGASGGYSDAYFENSNMFVTRLPQGQRIEEIMDGGDAEIGFRLPVFENSIDAIRFYGGGFYFHGDHSNNIAGWRARTTVDVTSDFQIGGRFQRDDERGSQGFIEMTIRFPFGHKKSNRDKGVMARLDESPERDIDIVTGTAETASSAPAQKIAVHNTQTNGAQNVIHVNNSAAGGGNGTMEQPYNSLQAAEAAALHNDIIYVHRGDGTATNQNQGITLSYSGLRLAGSGAPLDLSTSGYITADGHTLPSGIIIRPSAAPLITNINPNADGVTIAADNVSVTGLRISSDTRYGIAVIADGAAASVQNAMISDVTVTGAKTGILIHGANGGSVSAAVQRTAAFGNTQHGISVYDDTSGTFDVDLGGGSLGSAGANSLHGNTLEDLTIDYDGGTLFAQGNWWGQAGGPQARQLYFGAPLDDNLVGHWLLDEIAGTTVASRIGSHDGTFNNTPVLQPAGGLLGGAVYFTAANSDYITIADYDDTDTGDKLTVSYWINPDILNANASHIMKWDELNNSASSWGIRAGAAGDEILIFIADTPHDNGDNYFLTSNLDLMAGTWTNITMVYDGAGAGNADRLKVYKDGVQVAGAHSGTIPSVLHNTGESIALGRRLTSNFAFADYLSGNMDDVRVYNQALTAATIGEITRSRSDSVLSSTGSLSSAP